MTRNPLSMRLAIATSLGPDDERVIDLVTRETMTVERKTDLIKEGDEPKHVHLVMEGLACRYKLLEDGRRQILSLLLPGDFCDLHVALLHEMDHSIAALSPCKVVQISLGTVDRLIHHRPRLARALWWATLVDEAILRENIAGLGQRETDRQMAHLFCELHARLETVGLVRDGTFDFPVTQEELGDMLGVTTVHTNRTLMELRSRNLVAFQKGKVTITDLDRLKAFAGFTANYLHLSGIKREASHERSHEDAIFFGATSRRQTRPAANPPATNATSRQRDTHKERAILLASPMDLAGKRVLVVEDEFFVAEEMIAAVDSAGAQAVGPVATVDEALALIRKGTAIDAAILDINLGGNLVFPVAQALTRHGIPIVFVTGYDDRTIPSQYEDVPVFQKPADPAILVRTLFEH